MKANTTSHTWENINQECTIGWHLPSWGAVLWKRIWTSWGQAANKANRMLDCIYKDISSRDKEAIIPLYSVLVRSHLEHCVQFLSLLYEKDVDRLERDQRRVTKMIKGLGSLSNKERLRKLSLEKWRIKRDLITLFQYLKSSYKDIESLHLRSVFLPGKDKE